MVNSISPKDFIVCIMILMLHINQPLLYLPWGVMQIISIFRTKILGDRNLSKNFLHYDSWTTFLQIYENSLHLDKKEIEVLGLLSTYYIDNDGVGQSVYKLKDALTFNEFFENAMLVPLLENTIDLIIDLKFKKHSLIIKFLLIVFKI